METKEEKIIRAVQRLQGYVICEKAMECQFNYRDGKSTCKHGKFHIQEEACTFHTDGAKVSCGSCV